MRQQHGIKILNHNSQTIRQLRWCAINLQTFLLLTLLQWTRFDTKCGNDTRFIYKIVYSQAKSNWVNSLHKLKISVKVIRVQKLEHLFACGLSFLAGTLTKFWNKTKWDECSYLMRNLHKGSPWFYFIKCPWKPEFWIDYLTEIQVSRDISCKFSAMSHHRLALD